MTHTFIKANQDIQALRITQIIFDDSDLVSVKATTRMHGEMKDIDLLFSFKQFNDVLRYTGDAGQYLQDAMSDKLINNEKALSIISLEDKPIVFTTCSFSISLLCQEDENVFCVDEVKPLSFMQQAKNLKSNIRDYDMGKIDKTSTLKSELLQIAKMYRYYTGLLSLNLSESEARIKSGLENDKLFQLAFMACH